MPALSSPGGGDVTLRVAVGTCPFGAPEEKRNACLKGPWILSLQHCLFRKDGEDTMWVYKYLEHCVAGVATVCDTLLVDP